MSFDPENGPYQGPPDGFKALALRAGNYLVDDLHLKFAGLVAVGFLAYGITHAATLPQCKDAAGYALAFLGGGAFTLKRSQS